MNWIVKIASRSALDKVKDIEEEANKLAIVRILLGFFLMFRVFQLLESSQYYFDTPDAFNLGILFFGLTFLLTIGFLTPIVTLALLIYWHRLDTAMSSFTLGSSILMLLLAVFVFLNIGGLKYSLDSFLIKKRSALSTFIKKIYGIIGTPSLDKIHTVYFVALFIYGLISFGAIIWHLRDSSWINGTTVMELLVNSYLCKYFEFFRDIFIAYPKLFYYNSVFSIVCQSVFQLLMIPFLFGRYGIKYILFWGLGFFLVSLFVIQLSFLPHVELLFWFVIFYRKKDSTEARIIYDDYCNLCKNSVSFLKAVNWNKAYSFVPISTNLHILEEQGLVREKLQQELHGFVGDKLYIGYDLYLKLAWFNPLLFPFWMLLILGKYLKVGYIIYRHIAKNRHKYFGTCEIPFDVNKQEEELFLPKKQKNILFNAGMIAVFSVCVVYILFQFPFVRKNTLEYYVTMHKKKTYTKVVSWLNRTPFVMPLVFNKTDLMMGSRWAVIYRLKNGKKELVPITNPDGSRTNYRGFDWFYFSNLGSDLLYFGNSVPYRRAMIGRNVKTFHQKGKYGFYLISNRIKYDYRKTNQTGKVTYSVEVYQSNNQLNITNPSFDEQMIYNYNVDIQL